MNTQSSLEERIEALAELISSARVFTPLLDPLIDTTHLIRSAAEATYNTAYNLQETRFKRFISHRNGVISLAKDRLDIALAKLQEVRRGTEKINKYLGDCEAAFDKWKEIEHETSVYTRSPDGDNLYKVTNTQYFNNTEFKQEIKDALIECKKHFNNFDIVTHQFKLHIQFETNDITIGQLKLGPMKVLMPASFLTPDTTGSIVVVRPVSPNYSASYFHPHVEAMPQNTFDREPDRYANMCMGELVTVLETHAKHVDIFGMLDAITVALKTYNRNSPWHRVEFWRETERCCACNVQTHDGHGNPTEWSDRCPNPVCEAYSCSEHRFECACCGKRKCHRVSWYYDKYITKNCKRVCGVCCKDVCFSCVKANRRVKSQTATQAVCEKCAKVCTKCSNYKHPATVNKEGVCRVCAKAAAKQERENEVGETQVSPEDD